MENIKSSSLKSKAEVISDLKDIHQLVNSSKEGYQWAAEATGEPELKSLFSKLLGERIVYAAELAEHIALHDDSTGNEKGGILNDLQGAWLNIKQAFSSKNDRALLTAISSEERAAIKKYDECIANFTDHADHMTLLTEQREGLKTAVSQIETLIVRQNADQ